MSVSTKEHVFGNIKDKPKNSNSLKILFTLAMTALLTCSFFQTASAAPHNGFSTSGGASHVAHAFIEETVASNNNAATSANNSVLAETGSQFPILIIFGGAILLIIGGVFVYVSVKRKQ